MNHHAYGPITTLDRAIRLARVLSQQMAQQDAKTTRSFRAFQALTGNDVEAMAAFFIWKGGAKLVDELASL